MAKVRKRARVYADTSVFGGAFDEEFSRASRALFGDVRAGRLVLVYNAVNRLHGFAEIAIHTPLEVAGNEDEDI